MKCPNCSFSNPDAADFCKVCGFEIIAPTKESTTPPSSAQVEKEKENESEMDDALSALFGASVDDVPEVYNIELNERQKNFESSHGKPVRALAFVAALGILAAFIIIVMWPRLPFSSQSSDPATPVAVEPSEKPSEPKEPEAIQNTMGIEILNQFFIDFPNLINNNGIAVLNLFERPDLALESLIAFNGLGSIQSVTHLIPIALSDPLDEVQSFEVFATFYHEIDEVNQTTEILWSFELVEIDGRFFIRSYDTDADVTALKPPEPDRPAATNPPVAQQPVTPAEPAKPIIPTGFLITGGFSGGQGTDRYNLSDARYGNNIDFERLVFDFDLIASSNPSESIGQYSAKISDDGKSITVVIQGVDEISAQNTPIDFKGARTVKSVTYNTSPNASITITLSGPGAFRVFELKSPGRLIVDFVLTQ